jgi:hypothetical protein
MAGLIAPVVTGIPVDQTGQFLAAFGVAPILQLIGFIGLVFVLSQILAVRLPAAAA